MSNADIARLERAADLADARLQVAEDMSLLVAILVGCLVKLLWDDWVITLGSFFAAFLIVPLRMRNRQIRAEYAYRRATETAGRKVSD